MDQSFLCLSLPQEHMSPSDKELLPSLIMRGRLPDQTKRGGNTMLFPPQSFLASDIFYNNGGEAWQYQTNVSLPFDFTFFDAAQRQQRDASYARLAEFIDGPLDRIDCLYPFIALVPETDQIAFYHHLAIGRRGSLYVAYKRLPHSGQELLAQNILALIKASRDAWQVARRSFNNARWYSKWRPEMEMERKYTFSQPVNTWALLQKIYRQICDGRLEGFIPEFNDEFQIWDYDNYMFQVLGPAAEAGYISFIPQSDGRMTVKRKRFLEDSEIRQETLTAHVELSLAQTEAYAKKECGDQIRALPPFRRKRFDVNLESLETGNVFGIFLDICRPLDDDQHALYQCEVEYLRSRTMGPIHHVVEEYEQVCAFTKTFLMTEQTSFVEGYYSKLSFLQDYTAQMEVGV